MLRSYLRIALRTLRRRPGYTALNVLGLAVGFACCLLIGLYVEDELSYDRFHADAEALVAVGHRSPFWGAGLNTPYPLAETLAGVPGVEHTVRMGFAAPRPVTVEPGRERHELRVLQTDAAFFEAFTFPLARGDAAEVLAAPDGAVLTASAARTLFGDADPVGQRLLVERYDEPTPVTVTGVAADVPTASTIQFDLAISLETVPEHFRGDENWGNFSYQTYARLRAPADTTTFNPRLRQALAAALPEGREAGGFFAVPLPSLYLSELHGADGFRGQTRYLYLFGSVALFILLIAAINYVNLVTALGAQRAKEVGVRRTLGATRGAVARQHWGESALVSLLALGLAFVLAALAVPAFNGLFDTALALDVGAHGAAVLALSGFVFGVGVLAGTYPAVVLSRFRPVEVLRGRGERGPGAARLRRGLVVVQFALTVALLVATAAVHRQLGYMQAKDLGFDGEQVVVVDLPARQAARLAEPVREAALAHPAVLDASVADAVPGRFRVHLGLKPEEFSPEAASREDLVQVAPAKVDAAFVPTLGLRLLAGRSFDAERAGDRQRAHVLTRTAAEAFGWSPAEAVGRPFRVSGGDTPFGEVIGVVEDFHIGSLHHALEPVVLVMESEGFSSSSGLVAARLAPEDVRAGVAHLEAVAARFAPGEPFAYEFLDDAFDAMYRSEERLARVFGLFAGLAIFVACLGLFGLAAFTAERRTKEIGIRKVLGAGVGHLVLLLSKEFAALVAVALVVAGPLAYLAVARWLEDFAYRAEIGPGVFLFAGGLALALALVTVSYHAVRAATADPVQALRYE